jgi:hypothetical protein
MIATVLFSLVTQARLKQMIFYALKFQVVFFLTASLKKLLETGHGQPHPHEPRHINLILQVSASSVFSHFTLNFL